MNLLAPYIPTLLAVFVIVRRGMKPRRVKPDRLWVFPAIITALALLTIGGGRPLTLEALGIFTVAIVAGAPLGWFTAQHVELTLDPKTQTVMSKPTPFATGVTAALFVARSLAETWSKSPMGASMLPPRHSDIVLWLTDAGLLFVAARGLTRAWHMWIRTRPLLAPATAQLPPE